MAAVNGLVMITFRNANRAEWTLSNQMTKHTEEARTDLPSSASVARGLERPASFLARVHRAVSRVVDPPEVWQRKLAATVAAVLAIGSAIAASELAAVSSYSLIVVGMLAVTWYAGLRFALIVTALAAILSWVFIAEPRNQLAIEASSFVRLCIGITTSVGACLLLDAARTRKQQADNLVAHQKSLLEDLTASEARLSMLADAMPVLISYVDAEQRYTFNNLEYESWFGRDRRKLSGVRIEEVLGTEAYEAVRQNVERALSGQRVRYEALLPYKDAGTRWIHADYVPDFAPDGKVRGYFALVADETDRKRSEEALAESEARARGILEAAQDGIITIDEHGIIQSFNEAAERLFGYAAWEVTGCNVRVLMPSPYRDQHEDFVERYLATGRATIIGASRDVTARRKDGSQFPIRLAVSEVALHGGRVFTGIVHDLTERMKAQQDLLVSERRYRSLADATTSIVWVADANAQIVDAQPAWERYTGQTWPDYGGQGFLTMVHPDDRDALVQSWQSALAALAPHSFPARVWHAGSQSWRHCDTFAIPLKSESGEVLEWIGTTTDVEDAYQVAGLEDLRASDERTRLAESAARLGMWEWDLSTRVIRSEGTEGLFGLESGDAATPETFVDRVHPEDRERLIQIFRAAAREKRDIDAEFRIVLAEGAVRWLYGRGRLLPETGSQPTRMVGILMDITERVETREALARALTESSDARALVDAVLDTAPTAVALFDREMRYIRINGAAAEINGLPVAAHLGRRLEDVLPAVGPAAAARYRQVWATGRPMPVEEISGETPAEPGVLRWWDHSAAPVRDSSAEIVAVAVLFNETTSRKRAEQALQDKEQRERFLSEVSKELISFRGREVLSEVARLAVPQLGDICVVTWLDSTSSQLKVEPAGADDEEWESIGRIRLLNWQAHPGSKETVWDLLMRGKHVFIPEITPELARACAPAEEQAQAALTIGVCSAICLPLVARGATIGLAAFATTRSGRKYTRADADLAAEFAARAGIIADNARLLSELLETTEDLRHANAAKDDFLGLVSHELKTPITTIVGNSAILRRIFDKIDPETRNQALDDIYNDAGRLERLIDNMLILARLERGHEMELEPLILPRIVQRVVDDYRRKQPGRAIEVRSKDGDVPVLASPDYVEQVVNNLLSNADKYSPESAPIDIRITSKGDEVRVDIMDRGVGIAPEESNLIFEPFFRSPRTAGEAAGIGVGLAVCKRVIEAQRGRLWARPRPGGGSDFGFALPAFREE